MALIEDAGGCAIAITADVTDRHAVERAVAEAECQLGPVDLLVNNLASIAGHQSGAYGSAYQINKTALIRFTESLAIETKEHGISAFAINPGTVQTTMTGYWVESGVDTLPTPLAEQFKWMKTFFENGYGLPIERSVQLVMALASGKADVLSGCYISIDDDLDEMISRAEEIQHDELQRVRLRSIN